MDIYTRGYKSAEHYGLQDDYVESYNKFIKEGYSEEEAVFHALYEWDIILLLDEHGVKDADV